MANFRGVICLVFLVLGSTVAAQNNCGVEATTRNDYHTVCQAIKQMCVDEAGSSYPWTCSTGTCTAVSVQPNRTVPACIRTRTNMNNALEKYQVGYVGTCTASGIGAGPQFSHSLGAGDPVPQTVCAGPCRYKVEASSCGRGADGSGACSLTTTATNELCMTPPGSNEPTPEDNDPSDCDPQFMVAGVCINMQDMDGVGPPSAPSGPAMPGICIGTLCKAVPPNPNTSNGCNQSSTAAICTGIPAGTPPPRPSAPYPPTQPPAVTMGVSHPSPGSTPQVQVAIYGPPGASNAGPPDPTGNCPTGTSASNGVCVCPTQTPPMYWNGSSCLTGTDPNDEGEERTATTGSCSPDVPPQCAGDAIDCSVVRQTWSTRCALESTAAPPDIDINSDPFAEHGGVDAMFKDDEDTTTNPGELDETGLGLGSECPELPPINVLGSSIEIPPVWCELSWLSTVIMAIAYLIALKILYAKAD